MALCLKNPEAERLAKEISRATGESMTQAIITALQERLQRLKGRRQARSAAEKLEQILKRLDQLPTLDQRSADEILGYGETGVPE